MSAQRPPASNVGAARAAARRWSASSASVHVRVEPARCSASRRRGRRRTPSGCDARLRARGRPRRGSRRARRSTPRRGRSQRDQPLDARDAGAVLVAGELVGARAWRASRGRSCRCRGRTSAWRGSRSRVTSPAASAAGQNRLPGRRSRRRRRPRTALGLSPHTSSRMPAPTMSGRVRAPAHEHVEPIHVAAVVGARVDTSKPGPDEHVGERVRCPTRRRTARGSRRPVTLPSPSPRSIVRCGRRADRERVVQLHRAPTAVGSRRRGGSSRAPTRRRARRAGTAGASRSACTARTSGAASRASATIACGRVERDHGPARGTGGAARRRTRGRRSPRRRRPRRRERSARSRNRAGRAVAPLGRPRLVHRDRCRRSIAVSSPRDARGERARSVDDVPQAFAALVAEAAPRRSRSRAATPPARATSCSPVADVDWARRRRVASATSAGCRSTTPTRTRAWPGARSSTRSSRVRSTRCATPATDARGGRRGATTRSLRDGAADRPRAPRARARRAHRVAVPGSRRARRSATASWSPTGRRRRIRTRASRSRYPAIAALAARRCSPSPATSKRDAFARVRAGDDVPAARVDAERVVWLVDPRPRATRAPVVWRRHGRLRPCSTIGRSRRCSTRRSTSSSREAGRLRDAGPRRPDHVLAQGVHPADDAVPRPVRLLHVRQAAGAPRVAVPRRSTRCSAIARHGAALGCHEALFTLGEAPEARYPVAGRVARRARLRVDGRLPRRRRARRCSTRPACSPTPTPARSPQDELDAAPRGEPVAGDDDRDARRPARRARRPAPRRARQDARAPPRHARGRRARPRSRSPPASSSASARPAPSGSTRSLAIARRRTRVTGTCRR